MDIQAIQAAMQTTLQSQVQGLEGNGLTKEATKAEIDKQVDALYKEILAQQDDESAIQEGSLEADNILSTLKVRMFDSLNL